MDSATDLICPECGEQQPGSDECVSCGADLANLNENIPTMQGKKPVSAAWPTQTAGNTPPGQQGTASSGVVSQPLPSNETTDQSDTAVTDQDTTERPPRSGESLTAESAQNDPHSAMHTETFVSQEIPLPLPWKDISQTVEESALEASPPIERTIPIEPSDSTDPESQSGETLPPTATKASPQDASTDSHKIRHPLFWGTGQSLFGIFIVNTFLTLITFGIYSFWGRARVRSFLNSQTSFAKARFAYHGTGKELLTGWLKAMLVFGIPYLSLSAVPYFWQGLPQYIAQGFAAVLLLCFIPVAVVGAHRYRLSRTSLRNIRFSFCGTVSDYAKLWLKGSLLTILTLGLYYPYFENARRHYLVSHSQFGSRVFTYDGTGTSLFSIYGKATGLYLGVILLLGGVTYGVLVSYLAMPLTDIQTLMLFAASSFPIIAVVGLIFPWVYLQAARQRYFWNHTRFGEARFVSTVTVWKIFELRLTHLILLLCTLGLAWPWVQVRNLQFFYYYTGLHGVIELDHIGQEATDASPTGEELAGFFDTGFDLG
ncbi:MAG: DUF898 family protein [Nitrospirales bacterium]|nr:DUF898 family protein [Nitrospira sp.]MDR4500613.1 DUF898 family protein [Nitrospirales bacterium]